MDYQVYSPSFALQPFIKCFWTLEDGVQSAPQRQRVLPDGCMEMIFHYGDHYRQYFEDGSSCIQPRSFIFGQISRYIEIEPTGVSGIVSARFLPEGLQPFLPVPVNQLQDKAVALVDLFGEKAGLLEKEVLSAAANPERIQQIEEFLLAQLASPVLIDQMVRTCVEVIAGSQGKIGAGELAEKMKLNRRRLERKFASAIGMSPKQLSKAVRIQCALRMLDGKEFGSLTDLAYENGYYDQAHFIRDFREFTGVSPKSFFASNLKLAALFATAE